MKEDVLQNFKREQKKREFKEKVKAKFQKGKEFCYQNKDTIAIAAPIVASGLVAIIKVTGKHINLKKQEDIKELYCYDRSLGHYWSLRRNLTNKEWVEIDKRKKKGERLSDILSEMKVLK